jgi:hemolysin activation/secretion protein
LLFYDWGLLRRYRPLPGELQRSGVGSAGFGVRYSRGTGTSLRFDYAVVTDAGGLQGRGDARMHASLLYIF